MDYKEVSIKQKILNAISLKDYQKGISYDDDMVRLNGHYRYSSNMNHYDFFVKQHDKSYYYNSIEIEDFDKVKEISCYCTDFKKAGSCEHIAACLISHYSRLFTGETKEIISDLSGNIFNKYLIKKSILPKEEVLLNIELFSEYTEEDSFKLNLRIKLGNKKMYLLKKNNLKSLIPNIITGSEKTIVFGTYFSFNNNTHYFKEENLKILKFIYNTDKYLEDDYQYRKNNSLYEYSSPESDELLEILNNNKYILNNKIIREELINGCPLEIDLNKNNDLYEVDFNISDKVIPITDSFRYMQKGNLVYKLDKNQANLMKELFDKNITKLYFNNTQIESFSKSIVPLFKNNITVSNDVKELVIINNPEPKLYFDLYQNKIVCHIKFKYNLLEVDYFDDIKNTNIIRDETYELEVVSDLVSYHFEIVKKKFILDSDDDMANFLETGLAQLSAKYETFTSKKIKKMQIIKKSNISTTFSIGQGNIMSYNFDFDNIDPSEINNVLISLRGKKKYYHLKSGDFLKLDENNELHQLNNLVKDMELRDEELKLASGNVAKYRAIYFDSLKSDKYNIIKTDNLFDELVMNFKKYKDAKVTFSHDDLSILRDYQETGVKWLYNIHKTGFGGILADEMGLGKSIQTIYFIKELLKEDKTAKFLIVVPTSLAYNWENELLKFGKEISYKIVVGNKNKREQMVKESNDASVLITTYGLLREDREIYLKTNFTSIIIDEAQNIKNPNAEMTKVVKQIKAKSMFALTGTPIENSVIELWSIFDFIMPGFLAGLTKFRSKYKIKDFNEESSALISGLNKKVAPFILRRKKSDVIKELPPKIENNIYIDLLPQQKMLYVSELARVEKAIAEAMANGGMNKVRFMMLQLLTKLRQICIDPKIIFDNYNGGSGKMNNIIKIIKEVTDNGHKVLLFTSFRSALEIVNKNLNNNDISTYIIDGSISSRKRMELVDSFNNSDTKVFLIMLKAGGTGLNLTSADIVIHLDLWWNPQAENQATDRAHRIGQQKTVEVIRLITKGTIEEKILKLQEQKKMLSDKLIENNEEASSLFNNLTEKDIKELLAYENSDDDE